MVEPDGYFEDYEDDVSDYDKYDVTGDAVESGDQHCDYGVYELQVILSDVGGSLEIHARDLPGGTFVIRFPEMDDDGETMVWEAPEKLFKFTREEIPVAAIFRTLILPTA
jgi:hypothetical protein